MNIQPNSEALAVQFGDLLEYMPDAIVLVNSIGQIVLTTKMAENLFGYARGELRGKLIEALLPSRFRGGHIDHRSNYLLHPRNRSMGAGLELFGLRKDGSEFPLEISLSPFQTDQGSLVLTAIRDITQRKLTEKALQELSNQNAMLLKEMQHRIANSLQIIASILLLKASSANSEDARLSLRDAHQRVLSVAAVQHHLIQAGGADLIQVEPYITQLCDSLASSLIGDKRPIMLSVEANGSQTGSAHAVSMGLIVTELVMNAIKYAFPGEEQAGQVIVTYETTGSSWKLLVSDDGVGYSDLPPPPRAGGGLGTNIIRALAQQLDAQVEVISGPAGTSVAVVHSHPNPE